MTVADYIYGSHVNVNVYHCPLTISNIEDNVVETADLYFGLHFQRLHARAGTFTFMHYTYNKCS